MHVSSPRRGWRASAGAGCAREARPAVRGVARCVLSAAASAIFRRPSHGSRCLHALALHLHRGGQRRGATSSVPSLGHRVTSHPGAALRAACGWPSWTRGVVTDWFTRCGRRAPTPPVARRRCSLVCLNCLAARASRAPLTRAIDRACARACCPCCCSPCATAETSTTNRSSSFWTRQPKMTRCPARRHAGRRWPERSRAGGAWGLVHRARGGSRQSWQSCQAKKGALEGKGRDGSRVRRARALPGEYCTQAGAGRGPQPWRGVLSAHAQLSLRGRLRFGAARAARGLARARAAYTRRTPRAGGLQCASFCVDAGALR